MGRLHMKQTPAEREVEEERAWRKAQRAARKKHKTSSERKHKHKRDGSRSPSSRKKQRRHSDLDEGWEPPPGSSKIDSEALLAEMEEKRFREKLFDAMGEDEGLDGVEAYYNDPVHVPPRWRDCGSKPVESDLFAMDDEEYAEWVRAGMWRRTHRAEIEAQEQAEAEAQRRKDREKARREETRKMEREAEERRNRQQQAKEQQHVIDAWVAYDGQWAQLRTGRAQPATLAFTDLPWPTNLQPTLPLSPDSLSKQAISDFLLSPLHSIGKPRKQRLREALLLYHPDRFVAKWMSSVRKTDAGSVHEAVGRVARALTGLVEEGARVD